MIPIEKEPKELYEQFKVYENCKLCLRKTNTWHKKTNTPICECCSKSKNISDIK